jgi:hypothetical protein
LLASVLGARIAPFPYARLPAPALTPRGHKVFGGLLADLSLPPLSVAHHRTYRLAQAKAPLAEYLTKGQPAWERSYFSAKSFLSNQRPFVVYLSLPSRTLPDCWRGRCPMTASGRLLHSPTVLYLARTWTPHSVCENTEAQQPQDLCDEPRRQSKYNGSPPTISPTLARFDLVGNLK